MVFPDVCALIEGPTGPTPATAGMVVEAVVHFRAQAAVPVPHLRLLPDRSVITLFTVESPNATLKIGESEDCTAEVWSNHRMAST